MYMKLCIIELSIHWYQTLVSLIHLQFMKIKKIDRGSSEIDKIVQNNSGKRCSRWEKQLRC